MYYGIAFSKDYTEDMKRKDTLRGTVLRAQDEFEGSHFMGRKLDVNNADELISFLYHLYKDAKAFPES